MEFTQPKVEYYSARFEEQRSLILHSGAKAESL
jgi:hypothetical protein